MELGFSFQDDETVYNDVVEVLENGKDWELSDFPIKVWPLVECPLEIRSDESDHLACWLFDDEGFRPAPTFMHRYATGENVIARLLEDYYDNCDWYDGPSPAEVIAITKAEQHVQAAIDWWIFWNASIIRHFHCCDWWKPQWNIGQTVLARGLELAQMELQVLARGVLTLAKEPVMLDCPSDVSAEFFGEAGS
jgi:hypothetical protein